jgi:hypothetical protein
VALGSLLVAVWRIAPVASVASHGTEPLLARLLEAPLAALSETRSAGLLGVLALALAAACACRSLERRIGSAAPLVVTLLIFGSGSWALVWTAGTSVVPLALAVVALALAYEGGGAFEEPTEIYRPQEASRTGVLRWLVVGLLLAELVPSGPLLAGLLVPAALAVPRERRSWALPVLLGGFALGLAVELAVQGPQLLIGPLRRVSDSMSIDPALIGHNLLGLVAGRNIGLLTGFAPLLLLLALGRGSVARPALAVIGLSMPLLGALLLPFDHAAGWLNLSFLAPYGALWHLPLRQPRRWEWAAVVLLCALVTWPLWLSSRAAVAEGGVQLTGSWPRRLLPYEAALRTLPNLGEARLTQEGLQVRAVSGCRLLDDSGRFEMSGASATIWIAAPGAIDMVALELGVGAPSSFDVSGATAGRTVFRPDGRVGFELLLSQPRGRHRLWFDERPVTVHLIELRLPDWEGESPLRFRVLAAKRP